VRYRQGDSPRRYRGTDIGRILKIGTWHHHSRRPRPTKTAYDIMRSPPHRRHASWWNFPPQQFHNSFTKTQVNRSWKKGIVMLSVLYHAVLKFPNFHRVVENVFTKCATGIWPKEGVGVSGLGANAFSRRLARTSTLLCCSPPPLSPRSSLLSDSPRSSLLTAILSPHRDTDLPTLRRTRADEPVT
jgi:hypothetical protein